MLTRLIREFRGHIKTTVRLTKNVNCYHVGCCNWSEQQADVTAAIILWSRLLIVGQCVWRVASLPPLMITCETESISQVFPAFMCTRCLQTIKCRRKQNGGKPWAGWSQIAGNKTTFMYRYIMLCDSANCWKNETIRMINTIVKVTHVIMMANVWHHTC